MAPASCVEIKGVDVCQTFKATLKDNPDLSTAVAAIKTLMEVLTRCEMGTLQELVEKLNKATEEMKTMVDCSSASVASGGELFLRFITLASEELEKHENVEKIREIMKKRGDQFLKKLMESRPKIRRLTAPFITDGSTILVHSHSKCVLEALIEAHLENKDLKIFVTETGFDKSGLAMHKKLEQKGIASTVILDASVGYIMSQVDYILMGAEGVVESGGIVNKIGSYTIALCAKELNKPVYVLCESFKFVRLYPLSQQDLPNEFKYFASTLMKSSNLEKEHPLVDYTPPSLVTLLFTDLGILTPSAVSDELLKLYL